jgi:tetratricopeptide (TPR) repeat protein
MDEAKAGATAECPCRKGWVHWVLACVVVLGVLLPLAIMSWNAVKDHCGTASTEKMHRDLGKEAFDKADYQRAVTAYSRARALNPSIANETDLSRARLFFVALHPDQIDPRALADVDYELAMVTPRDAKNAATYGAVAGHVALLRGHTEEATKAYQDALAKEADNPGAHMGQALLAVRRSDAKKALEEFQAVLVKSPRNLDALIGLGDVRMASGDVDKAIEAYNDVLKDREDARIHRQLGVAYGAKKQSKESLGEYQKALALNPQDADTQLGAGNLLASLGALPEAEKALRAALQLRPDEQALDSLSNVLLKQGRAPEALQILVPSIQNRSAGIGTLLAAAQASEALGRKPDAAALYGQVEAMVTQAAQQLDKTVVEALLKEAHEGQARNAGGTAPAAAPK